MKKNSLIVLFIAFFLPHMSNAADYMTLDEARNIVRSYNDVFVNMKAGSGVSFVEGITKLRKIVGTDVNGYSIFSEFRVPNDIAAVGIGNGKKVKKIALQTYVNRFRDWIIDNNITMTYEIKSVRYRANIETFKGEDVPNYVDVEVTKKYKIKEKTYVMNEIVSIKTKTKSFVSIENEETTIDNTNSIPELLNKASRLYNRRKYKEAFALFEEVMAQDPKNQEASYSLGVMLFKNQGCKDKYSSRSARDDKAVEYWRLSDKGRRAIKYYSDNRY